MSATQTATKPEGKDQPWWKGLTQEEIMTRCPGASVEYQEGEMIVTGRPWTPDAGVLYDTEEGQNDQPENVTGDNKEGAR